MNDRSGCSTSLSRPDADGAIAALTFRKLKQITIKESLGVGKSRSIARFPCDSMVIVLHAVVYQVCMYMQMKYLNINVNVNVMWCIDLIISTL